MVASDDSMSVAETTSERWTSDWVDTAWVDAEECGYAEREIEYVAYSAGS